MRLLQKISSYNTTNLKNIQEFDGEPKEIILTISENNKISNQSLASNLEGLDTRRRLSIEKYNSQVELNHD